MKLTSEPKPVKIRIVSGGEEHSSLDSLRQNFCVSDLQKIESQLTQWLNRQGKEGEDIVQELEKIPTSLGNCNSEDYLLVYKVFFKDILPSSSIKTLGDVYKWFDRNAHKYRKNLKSLHQILWGEDEEYTLSVINQKENITEEMISKLRKEDSAQAHFLLGIYYAEIGNYTHLGVNLLRKAKKEGHKGAKRYLEEHNLNSRFPDIDIDSMTCYIKYLINGEDPAYPDLTNNEKAVRNFVVNCLSLRKGHYKSYDEILREFYGKYSLKLSPHSVLGPPVMIEPTFALRPRSLPTLPRLPFTPETDFLYYQKDFILSLIGLWTTTFLEDSKQRLEELSDSYYPAKYVLNDKEKHDILDKVNFRRQPLFKQIEIILLNLFEF